MKVFLICDCEYVAAETLEEAVDWYKEEIEAGVDVNDCYEVELSSLVNEAEEGEEPRIITLAEMLKRDMEDKLWSCPCIVGYDSSCS